jgi:hypothetical protein
MAITNSLCRIVLPHRGADRVSTTKNVCTRAHPVLDHADAFCRFQSTVLSRTPMNHSRIQQDLPGLARIWTTTQGKAPFANLTSFPGPSGLGFLPGLECEFSGISPLWIQGRQVRSGHESTASYFRRLAAASAVSRSHYYLITLDDHRHKTGAR